MIKKLLACSSVVAITCGSFAQQRPVKLQRITTDPQVIANQLRVPSNVSQSKTASINVDDTLWYFYNKQRFINTPANQGFYTIQGSVGTTTDGDLIEFGSSFLNVGTNSPITVKGAFLLLSKQANSTSPAIPVRVYLYNASASGAPTNKIDSVNISVSNTNGNFNYAAFTNPKTVTGSFFISYKIITQTVTDTLLAWVTSASTQTSSATASEKFGEGLSYTRLYASNPTVFNQFFVNTNFYGANDGFDFEAVVVPIVSFSINANYNVAAPASTQTPGSYCISQNITFTNTTNPSAVVYNRQFNFNRFATYWGSIASFSVPIPVALPIDNWTFNSGNVVTTTNASTVFATAGSLVAKLKINYRHSPFLPNDPIFDESDIKTTTYAVVACSSSTVATGIISLAGFESLSVYPNPTLGGKTNISGLDGKSAIMVYDMLGQLVLSYNADKETLTIDLSNKSNGNYFVKIINANNAVKVLKIVNQN